MILLKSTSEVLELTSSGSAGLDYSVSWVDVTTTTFSPSSTEGKIVSATTTTILAAPLTSTQRQVKLISIRNISPTASNDITIKKDISSTEYWLTPTITLSSGEVYQYTDGSGWVVFDKNGQVKTKTAESLGITGRTTTFYKPGTVADTIGYWYCTSKDAGFPGAWSPATPGVNGRSCISESGGLIIGSSSGGTLYITDANLTSTVAHWHMFFDVLWVNSGLVVTTTTGQVFSSVTLPSRDINGSTNGEGCIIAMLTTVANTNAGAISNATMSYTNSDNVVNRQATLTANVGSQITISPVIGTITFFNLAAGDKGVKSIQGITLGTSLGAGSISLMIVRRILSIPVTSPNIGNHALIKANPGVEIFPGSTILHCYQASAVTATTTSGTITIQER